jgi:tetratricopeptide (TPR) repeat protein
MSQMNQKPLHFKIPLSRFDVSLLPVDPGKPGTDRFKDAVIAHFIAQYASSGQQALVYVDDEDISVFTFADDRNPLMLVLDMLQEGRIKDAIPILEALARSNPADEEVLYNLGLAYSETGEFDQAIIKLKRLVAVAPKHARAWTAIGVAYQRMGKPELAMEAMSRAVAADPTDGYAQRNLGAILLGRGDHRSALDHFRQAHIAIPDDAQSTYGLAAALETAGGTENLTEADDLYKEVIERFPQSVVAPPSREARTRLAQHSLRKAVGGMPRPDVVMYIASALETFKQIGDQRRQEVAFEIAMKGQQGLDTNSPDQKYTLRSLPGTFSGLQLVAIMYAAFRQIDPTVDIGIDLRQEYEAAVAIRGH